MDILSPKYRKRRLKFTLTLAATLIGLIVFSAQTAPTDIRSLATQAGEVLSDTKQTVLEAQPGLWQVDKAIDGDTLDVTLAGKHERVRLLGIDTPETHDPRKPVQCFGEAAAAHTKQLLEGKNVRLEPDPTDSDRDKYNRLLRYVYLPDGTLINAKLIQDGYAFAYTIFPLEKLDDFRALETEARTAGRGLWSGCQVDETKDIKQTTSSKK